MCHAPNYRKAWHNFRRKLQLQTLYVMYSHCDVCMLCSLCEINVHTTLWKMMSFTGTSVAAEGVLRCWRQRLQQDSREHRFFSVSPHTPKYIDQLLFFKRYLASDVCQ